MAYVPSTNMDYVRCDVNCDPKTPQPGSTTESDTPIDGGRTITYKNFNGDYVKCPIETCNP